MPEYYNDLSLLGIQENKIKQFEKKGIHDINDLLMFLPRRYKNFGAISDVYEGETAVVMQLKYVNKKVISNNNNMLIAIGDANGVTVQAVWFRQAYKYESLYALRQKQVLVAGNFVYDEEWNRYSVTTPDIFIPYEGEITTKKNFIFPVYSKITGMSDEYLEECMKKAMKNFANCITSKLPTIIQRELNLPGIQNTVYQLHFPEDTASLETAQKRLRAEKLFYFAMMMRDDRVIKKKSPFRIKKMDIYTQNIRSLPYQLTPDQMETARSFCSQMLEGKAIHALVQGDVGCGKSIIAFLSMALMAENGYQSALMAPTAVLARQHFEDLEKLMAPYGIKVEFIPPLTALKKKEKAEILSRIESGESGILIGTHSLLSDEIKYHSLGLIITDEEHKFGVEQREKLISKTCDGVHYITMSATPIPRSLANVVYGEQTQLCLIQTMPAGRKPVQTAVSSSFKSCFSFIKRQLDNNRQVYVVCPQIENNEKMEGVTSVQELEKLYAEEFGKERICTLTGKNSKKETEQILSDFKGNKKSILIATTVIEVGVNVPNANTIIIHNAERFGLAGLHQLRGRVGRGGGNAYCILFSEDKHNERLEAMCKTTNGFEIAEADLRLRGAGNLFGTEQSGVNEYIDLVLSYPDEYKNMKKLISNYF